MLMLLPQVDDYIKNASGRDWTTDATIHPQAKAAASMLLTMWFENPGMMSGIEALPQGVTYCLTQLEAYSEGLRTLMFDGRNGAGAIALEGALQGDSVVTLKKIYGTYSGTVITDFETVISVDGEIQQASASDLSAVTFRVELLPA
jgi:hypothetical protein